MNKILLRILILFTILPYSIMGCPKDVSAQDTRRQIIRVSPVILPLQLSPNKSTPEIVVVENLLDIPVPIRLEVEELSLSDTSDLPEVGKNDENSIAEWVIIPTTEYILAPREKKEIPFQLQTPPSIPLGGYQAMIFIQPFFPQGEAFGSFLTSRIGILVLGSVGTSAQLGNASTIQSALFPQLLLDSSSFHYSFSLKSRSLYHFTARPRITLNPLLGKEETQLMDEKLMFPGKERVWEGAFPLKFSSPGWYSLTLQISVGGGQKVISRHNVFFFPPYMWVISGIILILAGIVLRRIKFLWEEKNRQDKPKVVETL